MRKAGDMVYGRKKGKQRNNEKTEEIHFQRRRCMNERQQAYQNMPSEKLNDIEERKKITPTKIIKRWRYNREKFWIKKGIGSRQGTRRPPPHHWLFTHQWKSNNGRVKWLQHQLSIEVLISWFRRVAPPSLCQSPPSPHNNMSSPSLHSLTTIPVPISLPHFTTLSCPLHQPFPRLTTLSATLRYPFPSAQNPVSPLSSSHNSVSPLLHQTIRSDCPRLTS